MIEPGDDPEVIRAKYFIRDEFLVSVKILICLIQLTLFCNQSQLFLFFSCNKQKTFSAYQQRVEMESTTVIHISLVQLIPKILSECSMIVET